MRTKIKVSDHKDHKDEHKDEHTEDGCRISIQIIHLNKNMSVDGTGLKSDFPPFEKRSTDRNFVDTKPLLIVPLVMVLDL